MILNQCKPRHFSSEIRNFSKDENPNIFNQKYVSFTRALSFTTVILMLPLSTSNCQLWTSSVQHLAHLFMFLLRGLNFRLRGKYSFITVKFTITLNFMWLLKIWRSEKIDLMIYTIHEIFHDGGPYHIKTSPLTCRANQWTGFYMTGA